MSSFTKDLTITKIKVKRCKFWGFLPFIKNKHKYIDMWRVDKAFEYHVGKEGSGEIISIPKGYITDGASIPRFLWSVVGHPMAEYAQAAVVHDYLYTPEELLKTMPLEGEWQPYNYNRITCDYIFFEAMGVLKVVKLKRMSMYQGVRRFGWIPWNKKRKK